ncbi:MAG: hypothetical protein IJ666_06320 [Ruminococcus sp.]|nr:hypothetical protein [Ruminococcus sp.]
MKYCAVAIVMIIGLLFCFPSYAYAENSVNEISLPVITVDRNDAIPEDTIFTVHLENVTENAPLPDENVLLMLKNENRNFDAILFDKPGYYEYRIWQEICPDKNIVTDTTGYRLGVYVIYNNDKLLNELTLWKEDEKIKTNSIVFENDCLGIITTAETSSATTSKTTVAANKTTTAVTVKTGESTTTSDDDNNNMNIFETIFSPHTGQGSPVGIIICLVIGLVLMILCHRNKNN